MIMKLIQIIIKKKMKKKIILDLMEKISILKYF